jgi:hypothetical protein
VPVPDPDVPPEPGAGVGVGVGVVLLVTVNFCAVNPHELPLLMPIDPEVASVGIVILTEESLTFVMPAS